MIPHSDMPDGLEVSRADLAHAVGIVAGLMRKRPSSASLWFEDGSLNIASGSAIASAPARGTWPLTIIVGASWVRRLAKSIPAGDPVRLHVDASEGRLYANRYSEPCTLTLMPQPIDPKIPQPDERRLILEAARILKPLLITKSDLDALVSEARDQGTVSWFEEEKKMITIVAKAWVLLAPLGVETSDIRQLVDKAVRDAWKGRRASETAHAYKSYDPNPPWSSPGPPFRRSQIAAQLRLGPWAGSEAARQHLPEDANRLTVPLGDGPKSANLIRQSAEVLPSFNSANKHIWFVIDGQQRLSVIYQAFEAQVRKNDAGRDIDFGRLCFVVHPDPEQEDAARIVYRKPVDGHFVPISDILSRDWKKRMPSQTIGFLAKIKICRERFLSYPVPMVIVRSATLDEIGEVFIRVNSQGMRITSADRAIALMGKLDVRAMAQELRQKVRDEVFALGGIDAILMGFNLITERPSVDSDPPKLEAMARRWSKRVERHDAERDTFRKQWHTYQNAFLSAVDYLHHRFPVHDESYLPSANMLATLAVFFYYHAGQPSGQQATEIRKWFWATGVAKRYSGRGYHRNIVADARLFESLARGSRKRFVFPDADRLDPVTDVQGDQYSSKSALARAFFVCWHPMLPVTSTMGKRFP